MLERLLVQNLGSWPPPSSNADAAAPSPSSDGLNRCSFFSNPRHDDDGDGPRSGHRICAFFTAGATPVMMDKGGDDEGSTSGSGENGGIHDLSAASLAQNVATSRSVNQFCRARGLG
jgi:hypothetical protein